MPNKPRAVKTYCTLREAFDLTGRHIYGEQWQEFEADCDPFRAKQQTDTRSLRFKEAPDGRSFTKERLPDPKRPIGKDGATLTQAAERHSKTLSEFLRLTHNGFLPTEFIPENNATVKEFINASAWPDPETFDPKKPTWDYLWFGVAADRVSLMSSDTSAIPGSVYTDKSFWWAYAGRPGRVEIDRKTLGEVLKKYVRSKKREGSIAETTARNAKIQVAAENIWQEASREGDRLTKEEVAKRLLARTDIGTLCHDLKKHDGGILSEDSLVRIISLPQKLLKRSGRKQDNHSESK